MIKHWKQLEYMGLPAAALRSGKWLLAIKMSYCNSSDEGKKSTIFFNGRGNILEKISL
jgi:hypothetical protein